MTVVINDGTVWYLQPVAHQLVCSKVSARQTQHWHRWSPMLPVPGVLVYLLKHMPHRKTMLIVYLSFNLDYSLLVLTEGALVKVILFLFQ